MEKGPILTFFLMEESSGWADESLFSSSSSAKSLRLLKMGVTAGPVDKAAVVVGEDELIFSDGAFEPSLLSYSSSSVIIFV